MAVSDSFVAEKFEPNLSRERRVLGKVIRLKCRSLVMLEFIFIILPFFIDREKKDAIIDENWGN